ncbi:MAG: YjjG family noncanonical pyrimidine nucleotidase [Candidatus Cloacimonetes bacterium]|nr:YjjG family noncanonical pyrimidine nucleotidase [Candidatus Cloacimonadota bacterium]
MKFRYILFDADGTLFDYEHAEMQAFKKTLKTFHIKGDIDNLHSSYKKINYAIWKDFEEHKISAEKLRTERFKRFLNKENLSHDYIKMSSVYIDYLSEGTVLLEDALETIEYLKERYSISLITNGLADVQYSRINKSLLKKAFDHIFISEEIGYPKPMKEIFDHVFKVLGYPDKEEVLIVGDSFRSDIVGGKNFGIKTCWFNPKKFQNENGFEPDYEIEKLLELRAIL